MIETRKATGQIIFKKYRLRIFHKLRILQMIKNKQKSEYNEFAGPQGTTYHLKSQEREKKRQVL